MPYVAKSYEGLPIVEEEYTKNGRSYCKVRTTKGVIKEVRTYTEAEYNKMYNITAVSSVEDFDTLKHILGFDKGYVTIFKGAVAANEEFFNKSNARFHVAMGWYIVSTEEVPTLPNGVTTVKYTWEEFINSKKGKK